MTKMVIATGLYPPDIGGPATYTAMLEEHLPMRGVALTVVPYGWVRRYPKPVRHLAYAWKLFRESRECDAIYALDPVSVGLPTLVVHMLTKKPYLLRVAGDYAWEQGQQRFGVTELLDEFVKNRKQPLAVRVLNWTERKVATRARHIVVPSAYMKRIVATWGVAEKKITPIYSALHPLAVDESRDSLRKMFRYTGLVITTAGRFVPWKGIGTLIEILPELKKKLGNVTLVIVGDGPLRTQFERQVAKRGLSDSVRLVGCMPKNTLGAAIKGSDLFVLNTAYEGMSHQLLEVMDLGVPIVTTDVGGNPELITDGVSGLMVPYNDKEELTNAIVRMATHTELREHVVQHGRLRVKDFSEEKVIGELVALLTHALSDEQR